MTTSHVDYRALHTAMQRWVDADLLPGVSVAVLSADGLHTHCTGFVDRERGVTLREDHLFRVFSNTKLITSCAALLLHEEGCFALDDPVERWLPALAKRQVLRPNARAIDDAVPARAPITIRHLLTHTSGLSYGLFDPGTPLFKAYVDARINAADTTLAQMVDALGRLPLAFEPGTDWMYSVATDVMARLVEVCSGQRFDHFIAERIVQPLGMADTGFVVPTGQHDRLAALYVGASMTDPLKPGLARAEHLLAPGAHLRPAARLSGGGGLVSSLGDMVKLLRALMPSAGSNGPSLLKPATLDAMLRNQLPPGKYIAFPGVGELTGKGFGLGSGVVVKPSASEHAEADGECYWGGVAGTQWWIAPRHGLAGALMTQRWFGYADPFVADLKREVYRAVLGR